MKNLKIIFTMLFLWTALVSCRDDDQEFGNRMSKDDLNFEIFQNPADLNMVILRSNNEKVIPYWYTPLGKSTRVQDTVLLPFAGTYKFVYGAEGQSGLTLSDTVVLEITTRNLSYVNDPLWTNLTGGGPGFEKQWLLDTEGKYFGGPLTFFGTNNGWLLEGDVAWDGGDTGCYGEDCWTWDPGVDWIYDNDAMTEGDYGVMTFSLKGAASFTAVKPMEGDITENGSYFLNVNNKTLTINDASILRGYKPAKNGLNGVSNWSNYTIFELDEDVLRLGVIRDQDVDGEGKAMLVYNFISKSYDSAWQDEPEIPMPDEGFNPTFEPGELLNMLTGGKSSGRVWRLDADGNPIDWLASGIGWTSSYADSYSWGWNDDWATAASNSYIQFDQFGGVQTYILSQNGTQTTSSFTINEETNEIVLADANLSLITDGDNGSGLNPTTNVIKVIKAFPDSYTEKGIWFGTSYNEEKDEWFVFHYILQ